jgi:hypothetical protein
MAQEPPQHRPAKMFCFGRGMGSEANEEEQMQLLGREAESSCLVSKRSSHLFGLREELHGYALMLVSALFFSASSFVVHLLGTPVFGLDVMPSVTSWFQGISLLAGALICILLCVDYHAYLGAMSVATVKLLALRGLLGGLGTILFLKSLSLLPFGDACKFVVVKRPSHVARLARPKENHHVSKI